MAHVAANRLQKRGANAVSFKSFGVACVLLRGRRRRPCVCRIPRSGDKCAVRVVRRVCLACVLFGGVFCVSCFCLVVGFAGGVARLPFRCPLLGVVVGSFASRCCFSACWLFVAGFGCSAVVAFSRGSSGCSAGSVVGSAVVPAWLPAVVRFGALGCLGRLGFRLRAVVASVVSASRASVAVSRLRVRGVWLACLRAGFFFMRVKATDKKNIVS